MPRSKPISPKQIAAGREQARRIGERIRHLRLEQGLTQSQVAGDRYSKAYISALETGVARPSMLALHHVAQQLRVPPGEIVADRPAGERVAMPATIRSVRFADRRVYVALEDGREVGLPVERSARLRAARLDQLDAWEVSDYGRAVVWPELSEEIGLDDFLGVRTLAVDDDPPLAMRAAAAEGGTPRSGVRRRRVSAYAPLAAWLERQRGEEVKHSFAELEAILGHALPESARLFTAPWYGNTNPIARAIRSAGRRASVDLKQGVVRFIRLRRP